MQIAKARRRRIRVVPFIIQIGLGLLALGIMLPFYWMAITSTLDLAQIVRYPPRLLPGGRFLLNFQELVARMPFIRAFANSLFIAVVSTGAQIFLCSLAGYAFAKYEFPGRDKLFVLLLATMMIPGAVGLIPYYIMMSYFGWLNTYYALIIPGMANAFGIFWMRQSIIASVPDEMIHAARIDGASDFGIYWRIVVPVVLPGIGALAIITFLGAWNEYLTPLIILSTPEKFTLPLILSLLQNQYGNQLHLVMIGSTLATAPVLIVFFMASQWFIKGLTAGSLKG